MREVVERRRRLSRRLFDTEVEDPDSRREEAFDNHCFVERLTTDNNPVTGAGDGTGRSSFLDNADGIGRVSVEA